MVADSSVVAVDLNTYIENRYFDGALGSSLHRRSVFQRKEIFKGHG